VTTRRRARDKEHKVRAAHGPRPAYRASATRRTQPQNGYGPAGRRAINEGHGGQDPESVSGLKCQVVRDRRVGASNRRRTGPASTAACDRMCSECSALARYSSGKLRRRTQLTARPARVEVNLLGLAPAAHHHRAGNEAFCRRLRSGIASSTWKEDSRSRGRLSYDGVHHDLQVTKIA